MLQPKRLSSQSVSAAIAKAERYRLLNEPMHAESICLDVIDVETENQRALIVLLLSLTDQFEQKRGEAFQSARELLPRLQSEPERHYYEGIVNERWGSAQLQLGAPADSCVAWFRSAMQCYERAEAITDESNPDPVLRWNTCLRILQRIDTSSHGESSLVRDLHNEFGSDVPHR